MNDQSEEDEKIESLEKFILNNPDLEKIELMLGDFNLFETLSLVNAEIRHSNVLSWLLDPSQNHGTGNYFLNLFIKRLISENKSEIDFISVFDAELFDLNNVEVRREWRNIDILVIIKEIGIKVVIAIENKIKSTESNNQLERYRKIVYDEFKDYDKILIYLTPEGAVPSDENWISFNHNTISELVEKLLDSKNDQLNESITEFIQQYNKVLKRYVVGNSEIECICKQIYKKHKQALDLIFQYKPDIVSDISDFLKNIIESQSHTIIENATKTTIRFTTQTIDDKVPKISEGWLKSKRILIYEIYITDEKTIMRFYIGPGNKYKRESIYNFFRLQDDLFTRTRNKLSPQYQTVYQKELLQVNKNDRIEFDDIKIKLKKKWEDFISNDMIKIDNYIENDQGFFNTLKDY
ncbi:MAG: PD-(D/E)XK nuclease family protein [Bacteroidales bacterium]|nr:PD-(D/E)XK nuclease family protein [Bacteroidales bacterium]